MPTRVTATLALLITCATCALSACESGPRKDMIRPTEEPVAALEPTTSGGATPALIEVRVLLVSQATRSEAEAQERAHMLQAMARNGEKLLDLVVKYSDNPKASEDLGVYKLRPAQPEPFTADVAAAAVALPIGAISEPVKTPDGYVVIERLKDPAGGPERIAAKHILIGYASAPHPIDGATRTEAEARAIAEDVAKQAHAPDADWDALAKKYTEEPGGKERAGDLGKFGHGQMVPAFEKAAFALEVGQVSEVVQSPFGFHVIKRYE